MSKTTLRNVKASVEVRELKDEAGTANWDRFPAAWLYPR
jgi:hypothetical protein